MGWLIAFALVTARVAPEARQQEFEDLLRTYPERPPEETFARVAALVDGGEFPGRDRAEYWIGSARLAAGDRAGGRAWFERLARDYPRSPWVERSWLGLGDALAQERRYGEALGLYARAGQSRDPSVRELGRISEAQARLLRRRQWGAGAAGLVALAVAAFFALSGRRGLWPMPTEARIAGPVLAVLAALSYRLDPAPRLAVVQLCAAGFLLAWVSGARLRSIDRGRLAHVVLGLTALGCAGYAVIYRADLVGMLLETVRAGPE